MRMPTHQEYLDLISQVGERHTSSIVDLMARYNDISRLRAALMLMPEGYTVEKIKST